MGAIKPRSLRLRLEEDLAGGYPELRKCYSGFLAHALKTSDAFNKLDLGSKSDSHSGGESFVPNKGKLHGIKKDYQLILPVLFQMTRAHLARIRHARTPHAWKQVQSLSSTTFFANAE